MYGFKTIVLSRKGFDSTAGYGYSPFDPETGKYIVLPIPDGKIGNYPGNGTKYEEIEIQPEYLPGIAASNLRDLIRAKPLGFGNETKKAIAKNYAHLDPWLGPCPWLNEKSNHSIGAFGQRGAAQGHLSNNNVEKGSLFLFFSRFTPIKNRNNSIGITIDTQKGAYFLYGWLRVGRVISDFDHISNQELRSSHPHATKGYFDPRKHNTIYVADGLLFGGSTIPGCGYFPRLSKKLLLTSEKHCETPSMWELPSFFSKDPPTYFPRNPEAWRPESNKTHIVKAPARGQEFVFRENKEFCIWFKDLIGEMISQ